MGGMTNFFSDLTWSDGIDIDTPVHEILMNSIEGAVKVERSNLDEDKSGTDYWVTLDSSRRISIDVKARRKDYGKDDIALEIWSVKEKRKIGWALDRDKKTDYILFLWGDSGRWCLVPFVMLMSVFWANGSE